MMLTPGTLKPIDDSFTRCRRGIDGKYWCVVDENDTEVLTCWGKNAKKNAVFFAAAPDMYEALKMALEDITGPITDSGIRIRFATLDAIKAVLAKIES